MVPVRELHQLKGFVFGIIEFRGLVHHLHVGSTPVLPGKWFRGGILWVEFAVPYSLEVNGVEEVHQIHRVGLVDHLFDEPVGVVRRPTVYDVHGFSVTKFYRLDGGVVVGFVGLDKLGVYIDELVGKDGIGDGEPGGRVGLQQGLFQLLVIRVDLRVVVAVQIQCFEHGRLGVTHGAAAGHRQCHAQAQRGYHEVGVVVLRLLQVDVLEEFKRERLIRADHLLFSRPQLDPDGIRKLPLGDVMVVFIARGSH